jgi:glycosyltransferase involved in cell wall biosynthesis
VRILLITNFYPPHHFGGYELSCEDTVTRWRARGHEVTVLTSEFQRNDVTGRPPTPWVRRNLSLYWRDQAMWDPGPVGRLRIERANHRALDAALEVAQPDVVSIWNLGAISGGLLTRIVELGIPIGFHVCNDWLELNLVVDRWVRQFLDHPRLATAARRLTGLPTTLPDVGRAGTFCWVSQSTWDHAEKATPWTYPRSIVVHSGIDTNDFPVAPPATEARPWRGRLLFVGRLIWGKGAEAIIDALAELPAGWTAELVGPAEPTYLRQLAERAEERGVTGRYSTREASRGELAAVYADADVLIFPSTTEPFGLVPIEAMACGTPVVASGAGGSGEFLRHGENSLLFEAGNGTDLAAQVERLAGDPALRLALTVAGRATALEFTVDRLAERLEAAHLDEVERRRGQAA